MIAARSIRSRTSVGVAAASPSSSSSSLSKIHTSLASRIHWWVRSFRSGGGAGAPCSCLSSTVKNPWIGRTTTTSAFSSSAPSRMDSQKNDGVTDPTQSPSLLLLVGQLLPSLGPSALINLPQDDVYQDENHPKIRLILASQSPRRREILEMMGLKGRFEVIPSPLDESLVQDRLKTSGPNSIDPREYTRILAEEKAAALVQHLVSAAEAVAMDTKDQYTQSFSSSSSSSLWFPPSLVLGSDTIVDLDGSILEKPQNTNDAKETLIRLSGRTHTVHTAVAIYSVVLRHVPPDSSTSPTTMTTTPTTTTTTVQKLSSFVNTTRVTFATLQSVEIDAYIATGEPMDKAGSYGIQGKGGQFVSSIEGDYFTVRLKRYMTGWCRVFFLVSNEKYRL